MQQAAMSLVRVPLTPPAPAKRGPHLEDHNAFLGTRLNGERRHLCWREDSGGRRAMVVEAKAKRGGGTGWMQRQNMKQRQAPPLPKLEDDGNPKFVIFIRMENVYLWYPLTIVTGGTTAKIMVAAKDNFLGKYIYKDTIARNLAAVIYKDEKEIQNIAFKQFRVLRSAKSFRYGYKLVENNNLRSALTTSDIIELPQQEELKTVADKVKDFFGDATNNAKESFGKIMPLNASSQESESEPEVKS